MARYVKKEATMKCWKNTREILTYFSAWNFNISPLVDWVGLVSRENHQKEDASVKPDTVWKKNVKNLLKTYLEWLDIRRGMFVLTIFLFNEFVTRQKKNKYRAINHLLFKYIHFPIDFHTLMYVIGIMRPFLLFWICKKSIIYTCYSNRTTILTCFSVVLFVKTTLI